MYKYNLKVKIYKIVLVRISKIFVVFKSVEKKLNLSYSVFLLTKKKKK